MPDHVDPAGPEPTPSRDVPPDVRAPIKTVGRAPRADFILDVALVSRLHCRLTAGDDRLEVVDLKSTNGTFVNDKRVAKAMLATGDRLRSGAWS